MADEFADDHGKPARLDIGNLARLNPAWQPRRRRPTRGRVERLCEGARDPVMDMSAEGGVRARSTAADSKRSPFGVRA
jgi:hypothetical protein